MSFGCRYNTTGNTCRRLGGECRPGTPGCVLAGRFEFPFHEQKPPASADPAGGRTTAGERPSQAGPDDDHGTAANR